MPFSNLIGNAPAKAYLLSLLEQKRLPNTLLFQGMDGIGKKQFALSLAKKLIGPSHAKRIDSGNHPDVHLYSPEGKSGTHSIASMRQLIEEVALAPFEAKVKIFLIEEAERMLPTSSNALLKTLEEPPLDSYLILLTSEPEAILPTITSRCRKVAFFPVAEQEIASFLIGRGTAAEEGRRIALMSQGSIAKAIYLSQEGSDPKRVLVREILDRRMYENIPALLKAIAQLEEEEDAEENSSRMKKVDAIFEEILFWFRESYINSMHLDEKKDLSEFSRAVELIAEGREAVQRNIKLRVVLEQFFLKASMPK